MLSYIEDNTDRCDHQYVKDSMEVIRERRPKGYFERMKNNTYPTMSLFLEPTLVDSLDHCGANPIFTFKENDHYYKGIRVKHKTYISIRKLYLEIADPTEYLFAKQVFGNYDHWKSFFRRESGPEGSYTVDDIGRLTIPMGWFSCVLDWRVELELSLRAKGLQQIIQRSGNSANAKWLVDRGWTTEGSVMNTKKRGRPSRAEIGMRSEIMSRVSSDHNKVVSLRSSAGAQAKLRGGTPKGA